MSTTHVLTLLSVLLAFVVIAVLAVSLRLVWVYLASTSEDLTTLAGALEMVETEHLRGLESSVTQVNAQFDEVLELIPGIAKKAAVVAARRQK